MVYGHRHTDHIAGALKFYTWARKTYPWARIDVWGSRRAHEFLKERRPQQPRPSKIVPASGRSLDLGHTLPSQLRIIGGHVDDDMMAILPKPNGKSYIHLADMVAPGFAPFDSFGVTIDLLAYIKTHRQLLKGRLGPALSSTSKTRDQIRRLGQHAICNRHDPGREGSGGHGNTGDVGRAWSGSRRGTGYAGIRKPKPRLQDVLGRPH